MTIDNTTQHFAWQVRTYYEDTDHGGVVYYANYLKFMERARTEHLRAHGIDQNAVRDRDGILFVVRSVQVDYLRPAVFNDLLDVSAEVEHLGRASLTYRQVITRVDEPETVLCRGIIKIASLDVNTMRPAPVPEYIMMEINGEC